MSNDPERQASQILQCLTQDKKPLGLLLGAGCPYSVKDESDNCLIPDIRGLTEIVKGNVCRDYEAHWSKIYSQLEDDGCTEPNIEKILSHVRGLSEYAGTGEVRGLNKAVLIELENKICDEIKKCVRKALPDNSTSYHKLAAWIGSIDRSFPIEIFTTNYDLLIEQALEDHLIPFYDGFVGSRKPFFDPYTIEHDNLPPQWARLWKIHGSINWRSDIGDHTLEHKWNVWRTNAQDGGDVVIHPSHLKYEQSRKMPYLAMMDRLRKFLSTPSSALIIVGYSFNDKHLNDVIFQGLQGTPTAAVFALMYGQLESYSNALSLAKKRGNLSIIAQNGAVIGTKEELWKQIEEQPDTNFPGIVEWNKEPDNDLFNANFLLGDFNYFGTFLQDISGKKNVGRKING